MNRDVDLALRLDRDESLAGREADRDALDRAPHVPAVPVADPAELGQEDAAVGLINLDLLRIGIAKAVALTLFLAKAGARLPPVIAKKLQRNYTVPMSAPYFEWDDKKAAANLKKHGISFEEAKSVFRDERAKLINDPDHSEGEDRFVLLGLSETLKLLVVCHCYRGENHVIRIISARKATTNESTSYR
jgi:uncharacterized DUF497 family protein